jgi:DNA-binding LacI/PurR family transcriptional regulator
VAGVSRGTVSRAINGGVNVRPAALTAVMAAIDTLGYRANDTARNLARGRTGSVAFVISERQEHLFEDPNFGQLVRSFSRELRPLDRHLLVTAAEDVDEESFLSEYLSRGHVDGALLALPHVHEPLVQGLIGSGLPFVVLGRPLGREDSLSWVAIDDEASAFEIVTHLVGLGRLPVATITGPVDTSSGMDRLAGFRRAAGPAWRPDLVVHGDWSMLSGQRGAEELLAVEPGLSGLFVASDLMAMGAVRALREAGRRVPDDVAIVGFDDSPSAIMTDPPLTTVRNPFERTAVEAVRILEDMITGRSSGPEHVVLPTELVLRASER